MTMVVQDSAAGLTLSKWTTASYTTGTANTGPFGTGDYAYAQNALLSKSVPNLTRYIAGFRIYSAALAAATLVRFSDGATSQVELNLIASPAGTLTVSRNGTELARSANGLLGSNRWYKIDFDGTVDPTTGSFNVWVDDVLVTWASGANSGVNTRASGTSQVNVVLVSNPNASGSLISHIYICNASGSLNNGRLAGFRCDALLLDGNDSVQGVSSGGGSSVFGNLNDTSDTTYNELTTGQKDQFTVANPISSLGTVYAVSVAPRWFATDAAPTTARVGVNSGGTVGNGAALSPPTAVADDKQQIFETDPNTSAAWLTAAVSAVKAFVEKIT